MTRGADGETAKRCACVGTPIKVSPRTASRFRLAGSEHDRRRSRASARRTLTGQAKQGSLTRRSTPLTIRKERELDSTSGEGRISTRVCLRVTKERQRSTRFGEGSTRTEKVHGESASSALNKASVSEVRRIAIGRS